MKLLWTLVLWLCLLATPFVVLSVVNAGEGPSHHRKVELCSRHCHDHGCSHAAAKYDWNEPGPKFARRIYLANIRALGSTSLGYENTNLVVYVLVAPILVGALLLGTIWPLKPFERPTRTAVAGLALLTTALALGTAYTGYVTPWSSAWSAYWYCTDFCIHAANLLGTTYEEFNFVLFVLGFPATVLLGFIGVVVRFVWGRYR